MFEHGPSRHFLLCRLIACKTNTEGLDLGFGHRPNELVRWLAFSETDNGWETLDLHNRMVRWDTRSIRISTYAIL